MTSTSSAQVEGQSCGQAEARMTLGMAAFGGPVGKGFEAMAVLPRELQEFLGIEIGRFFAKEGFEAPLEVGAFPRSEAVTAGGEPIELEQVPHADSRIASLQFEAKSGSLHSSKSLT
jgi:hypothetical protein